VHLGAALGWCQAARRRRSARARRPVGVVKSILQETLGVDDINNATKGVAVGAPLRRERRTIICRRTIGGRSWRPPSTGRAGPEMRLTRPHLSYVDRRRRRCHTRFTRALVMIFSLSRWSGFHFVSSHFYILEMSARRPPPPWQTHTREAAGEPPRLSRRCLQSSASLELFISPGRL
jgi:hypothetical protein